MKKMFLVPLAFAAVVAAGYVSYGAYSPQSEEEALLLENVEALTKGDAGTEYAWSHDIDCPGWFTGDYQVCQKEGEEGTCSVPGDITCECGKNCD